VDVACKDKAARRWCENATRLTETPWRYIKVLQKEFQALQPKTLADITAIEAGETGLFGQ